MSEFSDFCNMLREKSGMTIYYVAKVSDLERTSLNRMLNGKRLPGYAEVERFAGAIRANEKEKDHMKQLYIMEKMGKKRYKNCRYIERLLHSLDQGVIGTLYTNSERGDGTGTVCESFAEGEVLVRKKIQEMLEQAYRQTDPEQIYTNFPANDEILLSDFRFYEKKYQKQIPLGYFHILNVNPEQYYDADCNLKVLCSALIWTFFKESSYIPYYTYSPLMVNDLELQMMPYYLVTGDRVAHISDDFRQGIFLENPDTISFYQKKMQTICSQMKRLFYLCEERADDGERKPVFSLQEMASGLCHLNVELYEKSVVISKCKTGKRDLNVMVTESSLFESFQDYFAYREEIGRIQS